MTLDNVITLINNGFSHDEIIALSAGDQTITVEPQQAEPVQASEPKQEPVQAPTPTVTISDEQLMKLTQTLRAQGASVAVPPTVSLDDKLSEHLKALITG